MSRRISIADPHQILGIEEQADAEEIRSAYRQLARQLHPDASGRAETAAAFNQVTEAYQQLCDRQRSRGAAVPDIALDDRMESVPVEVKHRGRLDDRRRWPSFATTSSAEPMIPPRSGPRPEPLIRPRARRLSPDEERVLWLLYAGCLRRR